jgi:hypothetical protein
MANLTLRSVKGTPLTYEEMDGNFEYFTGSIDSINNATASFLTSADTSSFLTSADTASFVTSDETGSFLTSAATASLNISDTLYTVNTALSASTTSSATTSVCSYGVNIFEYVTPTNFATKLPQPTTGKSTRIINNSTSFLYVYPSNIGGRINNYPVDTPAILPPDGNLYEFICIENPLPGEWTFSAPATGQYDSGEISVSITAGSADGFNPWVTAINSTKYTVTDAPFNTAVWAQFGKNQPAELPTPQPSTSTLRTYDYATAFRPETPWKGISKIKVYTNLLATVNGDPVGGGEIRLNASGYAYYYDIETGVPINSAENNQKILFRLYPSNIISGTPTTGSSPYTSANIGDPGTIWTEKVAFTDNNSNVNLDGTNVNTIVQGTFIGNKTLGNVTFTGNYPAEYTGELVEKFYSSYISFQFQPLSYENYSTIPDFKFRFIIEYYQ